MRLLSSPHLLTGWCGDVWAQAFHVTFYPSSTQGSLTPEFLIGLAEAFVATKLQFRIPVECEMVEWAPNQEAEDPAGFATMKL